MAKDNQAEMVNARRPCFFEIFSSNSTAERLRIPVKFANHMEGRTSGSVSLTGPSGNIWPINLILENDDIFLDHGWSTFVKDHFIECGDVLVFRYDGELCFTVQVFDQSACEKDAAFYSKCSQDPSQFYRTIRQKREREEKAASSDKSCENVPKKVRGDSSELPIGITSRICEEKSSSHDTMQCESPCQNSAMFSQSKTCNEKPDIKTGATMWKRIGKEDENLPDRGYGSIFSEREKRVAQSFISCFPFFVRIMKRFNISGSYTLNIPYQFSTEHLPNCKTEIVLRTIKGAFWTVNSVPTTRVHTSHTFCGGWMAFVRSNDIKLGDVCIFELVRKYELRVFILRVGKEVLESQSGKVASNGGSAKIQAADFPNHTRKLVSAIKGSANGALCSQPRADNKKLEVAICSRKNSDVELSSNAEADLRMMVTLSEEKATKSFTSGFPNFIRIMRKFNISGSYTLKIPHQFSALHLPNYKTEIVLRNSQGEHWTVNSVPDSKGRAVHTFCGGWMAFVRDNDVKMGDICIFELVSKSEMLVHISEVGRKALHPPP